MNDTSNPERNRPQLTLHDLMDFAVAEPEPEECYEVTFEELMSNTYPRITYFNLPDNDFCQDDVEFSFTIPERTANWKNNLDVLLPFAAGSIAACHGSPGFSDIRPPMVSANSVNNLKAYYAFEHGISKDEMQRRLDYMKTDAYDEIFQSAFALALKNCVKHVEREYSRLRGRSQQAASPKVVVIRR